MVNQLLTQFDGVEGREGVAIVAASSRPDLLDPALLRPGRLDKSLLCPLPDEQTRVTILDTLCKRHSIDVKDLDFMILAKMTSGFTGADINAILTQARLNAVEKYWEKSNVSTLSLFLLGTRIQLVGVEIVSMYMICSLNHVDIRICLCTYVGKLITDSDEIASVYLHLLST